MEKYKRTFYIWVTSHRKLIMTVFILLALMSALMKPMVGVNYDIKDYLPEDSSSTIALDVMQQEYTEGVPNARAMLMNVSVPEALEYKEKIENVEGVESVTWLDDSVNAAVPVDAMDDDLVEQYYKGGNALFQITIDKNSILTAVPAIEEIIGVDNALTGDAVSTAVATESTVKEIMMITVLAVIMVLLILIFATESWLEPLLILAAIGVAIIINSGTNIIFGEISFVTNAAGSVLQLAVSLDYAVFLLHRYHEYRLEYEDPHKAMVEALCKATNSILSSGITTVIGFMALVLMRFLLGPDLGWALAKGIAISLICVFVFLPALFLTLHKAVEKVYHRDFLPSFNRFGKLVAKVMIPCVCIFTIVIVPAFMASNANSYYYGAAEIFGTDTDLGRDTDKIEEVFGESDTYALLLPKGQMSKEKAVSEELQELEQVTSVISYVDTVGAEVPVEYLDDDIISQLNSDTYTRMVITVDIGNEGQETFDTVEAVKNVADKYYPGEYHLAGSGPSNYDLMDTITEDMLKVNLIAIAAVYLVLLLMMKSFLLPFLLVISIETAMWINTAIPYFAGDTVFYIAYLIISTVQLGATVDYAILFTDRYRECREEFGKREAIIETIEWTVPSILVSGLTLTIVGALLGALSTHGLLAQLGVFIGRGAVCSMIIVFFVLPGLLYLFDKLFINRGKMKMKKVIPCMLAVMMAMTFCMPSAVFADTMPEKEEVVYGNLSYDGSVEKVYTVNIFEGDEVTDHGDYTELKNLTTSDKLSYKDGKVTATASKTPFYYQGVMENAELPWNIDIDYSLDGEKCEADDLAGKSGALQIGIDIDQNAKGDSFFYENYALQVTVTMDGNYCRNITAEGATAANVGSDKQLTYTVLPGSGTEIEISADVTNFEMAEISINGIKLNMDIDVDTSKVTAETEKLEEGTAAIDDGAADVKAGAGEVKSGSEQVLAGVKSLEQNVNYDAYKAVMKTSGLDIDQLLQGNSAMAQEIRTMLSQYGDYMDPQEKVKYEQILTLIEGNSAAISGTETYLDTANSEISTLLTGTEALVTGAKELYSGASYLKSGTGTLKEKTSGVDEKIIDEVDSMKTEITGSSEVRSFTSDKNTNVTAVQFVLKTKPIEIPELETAVEETPEPGFFEKLLNLFKK